MTLGFIGTGNMGGALVRAAARNPDNEILITNRSVAKAEALSKETGAKVTDKKDIIKKADFIFLGVKPQMLDNLAGTISDSLKERGSGFTVVSMLVGTAIEEIREKLGGKYAVIRIMPNTPVSVGEGMILYSCSENVDEISENTFLSAMKSSGKFVKIDEKLIDAGSSVSGCGPAFAAVFMEALADGGVACGLPREKALEMAAQMMLGTAKLYLEGGKHPGIIKDEVCSPGGTTIQGVRALEKGAFRSSAIEAVIAAYKKNSEVK